jgi:DNA-binding CsgD family transcriptional regulator
MWSRWTGLVEGVRLAKVGRLCEVTPKAIEGHLARAYAKLGIKGRAQLAQALAAEKLG